MVGGGNKRDDVSLGISSTNIFAALDSRRRKSSKKKSDKDQGSTSSRNSSKDKSDQKSAEPQQFWAPAPVTAKSWADVDDDEDYYATTAPPLPVWGSQPPVQSNEDTRANLSQAEESDGEEDAFDEVEDDAEEEQDHEVENAAPTEPVVNKTLVPALVASREPERQLSKKELKKKELAELDAVLAELGLGPKETNELNVNVFAGFDEEAKPESPNGDVNSEEVPVLTESKSSKRRKAKKEKSFKEQKDEDSNSKDGENKVKDGENEQPADEEEEDQNATPIDPKERIKKIASFKKKKSSKELDAAAKAAAIEAAARAAKLAAAKKKEKNHYNQQPVR